ncbi:MAG TPA: tetratricopeptide repeat protein [Burkholderiaceae bacterium]
MSSDAQSPDQALLDAVRHHQAGQLQDAERLYRAILQADPQHPDANHNLGLLAVQVQQPVASLPHFEAALAANPQAQQYWLSYIDALIQAGRPEQARQVLALGRQHGLAGEVSDALSARMAAMRADQPASQIKNAAQSQPAKKSSKGKAGKEPDSARMHNLVELYSQGRYADTEAAARLLIEKFPDYGFGWKVLGAALQQQARPDEAMQAMKKAAALLPNDAEAHGNLGNSFKEQGLLADATASYQRALAINPDYAEAHYNLGNTLMEQGQLAAAEASLRRAITIKPDFAIAHNNLGNILKEQGRHSDAQASYRRALEIKPDYAEAHNNMGATFKEQGLLSDAEASYRRAIEIKPNYASAHYNLGNTFKDQRKHAEAENCYRCALEIKPDYAEAHSNLGVILMQQGRYAEAEVALMHVLKINPNYAEAYINLGSTFLEQGRLTESETSYRHAQQLQPEALQHALHANLMLPIIHDSVEAMMLWRERYQNGIHALTNTPGALQEPGNNANPSNFYLAYHNANDRPLMQALHQFFRARLVELTATATHILGWQSPAETGRRIRVGFLSELLVAHTIGKLYQGFIRHLDRSRFEVVIIHAPKAKQDSFRQSLDAIAEKVLTLPAKLKDQQQAVAAEALDVLFFPDIGMASATYFLAYARLAPVQAVGWGHPDTTGLDTMDYFVSAASIEPDDAETHYSERLIRLNRLPCFYQPVITVTELPSRAALGLPESGTLYGCPQTLFKIHPDFDNILAAIAEGDPTAHIVLLEGEKPVQCKQLRARWSKSFPILLERVLFLPRMPLDRFMGLMAHIDVLLDPVHFGSGNTLYEGMVYGTPVVTYPGQFMRGRIVAGAYRQMGIDNAPIAARLEDYAPLALALGRDPEKRRALRHVSVEAAKRELFEDMQAVREFECFLTAAVTAAGRGEKLPVGWRPDIHKNHNQGVCA